jgi:hypothetical protein
MNKRTLLQEIASILSPHQSLWMHELLFTYPDVPFKQYRTIIDYLDQITDEELRLFENDMHLTDSAPAELSVITDQIKSIYTYIPSQALKPHYYDNSKTHLNRKMSFKKNHEVQIIQEELAPLINQEQIKNIIDIGAGAAQLSQQLVETFNLNAHCYEMNAKLQQQGIDRLTQYYSPLLPRFHFFQIEVDKSTQFAAKEKSIMLGLHACGGLSNQLIDHAIANKYHLYNYGCCYFKADMQTNISSLAQEIALNLTPEARHLAAHSYHPLDQQMFQARNHSKMYRYPLHFFMQEQLQMPQFMPFKKNTVDMKLLAFGEYALLQLKCMNIAHSFSVADLQKYWEQEKIQGQARQLMLLNIVRGLFGRLIELYMVLDRALYLEENHFEVSLRQTFDRTLSPRNLRIWATQKSMAHT